MTSGGLRLYLSSLSHSVLSSGPSAALRNGWGSRQNPLEPSSRLAGNDQRSAQMPPPEAGDSILAVCPDSVARELDRLIFSSNRSEVNNTIIAVPGGVAETLSIPMNTVSGAWPGGSPILPGGLIWDIPPAAGYESAMRKLVASSQTPQDAELDIGLTPAYCPPSKIRSRDQRQISADTGSHLWKNNSVIVWRYSRNHPFAIPSLMTLANIAFQRPNRYLFDSATTAAAAVGIISDASRGGTQQERMYRISKRFGFEGFSKSAMENDLYRDKGTNSVSASSKRTSKSVVFVRGCFNRPSFR